MAGPSGSTPILGLPYPTPGDNVDVPRDLQALASKLDVAGYIPVGGLVMWPTVTAPDGWLLCNGTTVPASSYPGLAAVLGTTAGNITLPDMRGRVPFGSSSTHAVGGTGGAETVALAPAEAAIRNHTHGGTTGQENSALTHAHAVAGGHSGFMAYDDGISMASPGPGALFQPASGGTATASGGPAAHTHGFSTGNPVSGESNGAAHENMPPYRTVNFIIRAA